MPQNAPRLHNIERGECILNLVHQVISAEQTETRIYNSLTVVLKSLKFKVVCSASAQCGTASQSFSVQTEIFKFKQVEWIITSEKQQHNKL